MITAHVSYLSIYTSAKEVMFLPEFVCLKIGVGGVGANRKAWAMHVNFSSEDPCCYGNKLFLFEDKIGCRLTRASNAETQLLGYIGYIAWQWDIYLVPQNVFLVYFCHLRLQRTLYKNEL